MSTFLQAAVYQQLSSLEIPVYDLAPPNASMPYISIGHGRFEALDNLQNRRQQGRFFIGIWSNGFGFQEAKTIEKTILDVLNTDLLKGVDARIQHFELENSSYDLRGAQGLIEVSLVFKAIIEMQEAVI